MLRPRPQELLQDPANIRDTLGYDHFRQSDLIFKARVLHDIAETPDVLDYLDDISTDQQRSMAHSVMRDIEPHLVAKHYGPEALVWTAVQEVSEPVFDRQTVILKKHGYDNDLIRRACRWSRHYVYQLPNGAHTVRHYDVMQHVVSGALDAIDLPRVLQDSATQTLSSSRLSEYGLLAVRSEPSFEYVDGPAMWGIDPGNTVWVDTPVGFLLTYKGEPNAVVGLATHGDSEVMIHQLQGSKPKRRNPETNKYDAHPSRGLAPVDWRRAMVTVVGELVANVGIETISIQQ